MQNIFLLLAHLLTCILLTLQRAEASPHCKDITDIFLYYFGILQSLLTDETRLICIQMQHETLTCKSYCMAGTWWNLQLLLQSVIVQVMTTCIYWCMTYFALDFHNHTIKEFNVAKARSFCEGVHILLIGGGVDIDPEWINNQHGEDWQSAFNCPCELLIANHRSWSGLVVRTLRPYYLRVKHSVATSIDNTQCSAVKTKTESVRGYLDIERFNVLLQQP